ncbi:alpha/beta fold hydrolase [Bifidobacterium sp. 64T4]|uniref:alpha/beta fold hydrolase n=1 Tax=Bifidobacterium pongonis TaxID=2834432 RepID=UPI001C57CAFD|nr:alpha/beta fold hydrolase [Bifidobacterium pongonis]MBW3094395.1 alpha/beta fold hydrolase [Bifidobacterium pongonis]
MEVTLLDERNYADTMANVVKPALKACLTEGRFDPAQAERDAGLKPLQGTLRYLAYDAARFDTERNQDAAATFRGCIVLSHGFTEFAEKYDEMIWYFLLAGYSVCAIEHRGHGGSARDVDDRCGVWIDDWRRYVADLAGFAETVGRQYADGHPLYLYSHSMGGGIGAAVLERCPALFDKAVLSSPMIAPQIGMPLALGRPLTALVCGVGLGRTAVFGQKDFDPSAPLDMAAYPGASEPRERYYHGLRSGNVAYQTSKPTFQWVRQALKLNRALLDPEACGDVETPILLFQSGRDEWVLNEPQDWFVDRVRAGGCPVEKVRYDDSLHEIFSMPNDILEPYVARILDFYGTPTASL